MEDYNFAARLKQARSNKGWTQTELGRRSKVHSMAISRLERGEKLDVTGATLRKLAGVLDVTSDWLLGMTDEEKPRRKAAATA
jgi:transcriptional regulator with XRE-family HTH domain